MTANIAANYIASAIIILTSRLLLNVKICLTLHSSIVLYRGLVVMIGISGDDSKSIPDLNEKNQCFPIKLSVCRIDFLASSPAISFMLFSMTGVNYEKCATVLLLDHCQFLICFMVSPNASSILPTPVLNIFNYYKHWCLFALVPSFLFFLVFG